MLYHVVAKRFSRYHQMGDGHFLISLGEVPWWKTLVLFCVVLVNSMFVDTSSQTDS